MTADDTSREAHRLLASARAAIERAALAERTDDTSREGLVDRVGKAMDAPGSWRQYAEYIVDTIVMPLVEERDTEFEMATGYMAERDQLRAELYDLRASIREYADMHADFPAEKLWQRVLAPTMRQVGKDLNAILDANGGAS